MNSLIFVVQGLLCVTVYGLQFAFIIHENLHISVPVKIMRYDAFSLHSHVDPQVLFVEDNS